VGVGERLEETVGLEIVPQGGVGKQEGEERCGEGVAERNTIFLVLSIFRSIPAALRLLVRTGRSFFGAAANLVAHLLQSVLLSGRGRRFAKAAQGEQAAQSPPVHCQTL